MIAMAIYQTISEKKKHQHQSCYHILISFNLGMCNIYYTCSNCIYLVTATTSSKFKRSTGNYIFE